MRFKSIWLGPCYMHPLGRSHYEWHSPVGLVKFRGFAGEYEMEFQGVKRKLGSDTFDCARREAEEFVADECRRTLEQLGVELFADPAARPLDVLVSSWSLRREGRSR